MRSRGNSRASQWHITYYLMSFLHITIGINPYCITEMMLSVDRVRNMLGWVWAASFASSDIGKVTEQRTLYLWGKYPSHERACQGDAEGYRALEMETLAYSPLTRRVCACCLRVQLERWGRSINAGGRWSPYSTFHITRAFFINSFFLLSVPWTFSVAHFFGPRSPKLTRRTLGRNRIKISSPPCILCQNISLDGHNADEGRWTLERTILNKCIQLHLTYRFQRYINLRI